MSSNEHQQQALHSIEMEQAVLGALLLDNDSIDRILGLRAEHFFRDDHRVIFSEIISQINARNTVDVITLFERLNRTGKADHVGGLAYLNALAQNTPSAANVGRYAEMVIERWRRRIGLALLEEARALMVDPKGRDASNVLGEVVDKLGRLSDMGSEGPKLIGEFVASLVEEIDDRAHGGMPNVIATGFRDLDNKLDGGMNAGELIILAGRPSMGKTALAVGIGANVARARGTVLIFSLEMPAKQLAQRSLAREGLIDFSHIKNGSLMTDSDFENLAGATDVLLKLPIRIDDRAALSVAEITSRSRAVKRKHGLSLIVVDYISLMEGAGENRTQQVGSFSRGLKALAKSIDVPVIALSQLNRSVESRADKRPIMSDLRESGDIEQDADVILFIYRDEVYKPESPYRGTAEIIISKHRNGEIGMTRLAFIGERTMFADLAPDYIATPLVNRQPSRGLK
jgi:replicative DNA helicase